MRAVGGEMRDWNLDSAAKKSDCPRSKNSCSLWSEIFQPPGASIGLRPRTNFETVPWLADSKTWRRRCDAIAARQASVAKVFIRGGGGRIRPYRQSL